VVAITHVRRIARTWLSDCEQPDTRVGIGNAFHPPVGGQKDKISLLGLGAHPEVVFVDPELLAGRLVDPFLDIFRAIFAQGLRQIFLGNTRLHLRVNRCGVVCDIEDRMGPSPDDHRFERRQIPLANRRREPRPEAQFGERDRGDEAGLSAGSAASDWLFSA
jgi:hypothetical protein